MFRIFIICVLALQVQSRPFHFMFMKPLYYPWSLPPSIQQPIQPSFRMSPLMEAIRLQNSLVNQFRGFLKVAPYPPQIQPQSSFSPASTFGPPPPTPTPFQPTFEPTGPPASVYGPPGYHSNYRPNDYETINFQPPNIQPAIAFNSPPSQSLPPPPPPPPQLSPQPQQIYGSPPPPNSIYSLPPNQFPTVNSYPPLPPQMPFATYSTNVLPLNTNFQLASPGPYLPPVPTSVNRFNPAPSFDSPIATPPAPSDSKVDANEQSPQTTSSSTLPPIDGSTLTTPLASTTAGSTGTEDSLRTTTPTSGDGETLSDSASSTTTTAVATVTAADAPVTSNAETVTPDGTATQSAVTATIGLRTGDSNNDESSNTDSVSTIESSTNGVSSSEASPATELAAEPEATAADSTIADASEASTTTVVETTAANETNAVDGEVTTSNNEENEENNTI